MVRLASIARVVGLLVLAGAPTQTHAQTLLLHPERFARVGVVDARFQSYNVEMAQVIGGMFWKPYPPARADGSLPTASGPVFEARPAMDLANPRLRKLAAALGPAYVRVSGSWANTVYFSDTDTPPAKPPPGFRGVLTRAAWAGVSDFARAVNGDILTSFAIGPGVRNTAGVWTPAQASALLDYTKSIGGKIAAVEFFNEPTMSGPGGGAPRGYTAKTYGADTAAFVAMVKAEAPQTLIVGPSSTGEGMPSPAMLQTLTSDDLLAAAPRQSLDVFSYHFYGALSQRCAFQGAQYGTSPDEALSPAWLSRTDQVFDFYKALQVKYAPGKPIWVTETAQAACGGDRWASTFLDSFRYLDQMGRLAQRGVSVIFHNTLAASDYGLIDQQTLEPRPDYWAALLWRRLMGRVVLDAGPAAGGLHLYAQCLRGSSGGVALLAINTSRTQLAALRLPTRAEAYRLSSPDLQSTTVRINGQALRVSGNADLPAIRPRRISARGVDLPPVTISFIALPAAHNPICKMGA